MRWPKFIAWPWPRAEAFGCARGSAAYGPLLPIRCWKTPNRSKRLTSADSVEFGHTVTRYAGVDGSWRPQSALIPCEFLKHQQDRKRVRDKRDGKQRKSKAVSISEGGHTCVRVPRRPTRRSPAQEDRLHRMSRRTCARGQRRRNLLASPMCAVVHPSR